MPKPLTSRSRQSNSIQVPRDHYFDEYDDLPRFVSYYHQIDLIKRLQPSAMLEIGVGNGTVARYLRDRGLRLFTCDIDPALRPDVAADIARLPYRDAAFPLVAVFEVLEHLPWSRVEPAVAEIHRVTRRYVLISIPHSSVSLDLTLRIPILERWIRRAYFGGSIHIPLSFLPKRFQGEHHWEMGRRNHPARTVRRLLEHYFTIEHERRPTLQSYHHFFVLRKR